MAFLGSCSYSIDTKKRVVIPGKYREELGNVFYVTRSLEGCLTIYTESEWEKFQNGLNLLPSTTGVAAREYFMSLAQKCQPDASGRILLEDCLLQHAKVNKNVVFVGAGHVMNIWAEELWSAREANRDLDSIRALLQQFGL